MRTTAARAGALGVLLAAAAACAFLAYRAFTPTGHDRDDWSRAIDMAQRAERTKAVLPALRLREQAAVLFDRLALSGTPAARSRAKELAALLEVRNADEQADPGEALALAVAKLQGAVRLDRSNDDAAYDLELLLSRSVQSGQPIGRPNAEKKRKLPVGRPGTSAPGTGY